MNTTQHSSPQILSGSVVIGRGKMQTVAMETMASRSHRWFRVDELSVSFFPTAGVGADSFNSQRLMGSFVWIRARAYRQDLMMNYVPTWLLGPRLHEVAEVAPLSANINFGDPTQYGPFETYRWKFPKPFFLPPGSAFITQLQRNQIYDTFDADINANIVVRGAQLSEQEARAAMQKGREGSGNPLPYIAAFTPQFTNNLQTKKSNNLDLANPFLVPLQLQRMTARAGPLYLANQDAPPFGNPTYSRVRLTDTRTIICEVSPMRVIFPQTQLAWTHTRVLQPGEYITAELRNFTTGESGYEEGPQVAIIGYRNEVLS